MKTFFTFLTLTVILAIYPTSAYLYLDGSYNLSAVLTLVGVVSMAAWIKSNGFLNDRKRA